MDAFQLLGLGRSLVLDPERLDAAYTEASRREHPDAGGSRETFEALSRARSMLERPRSRLQHWLELEGIEGELRGAVSASLMDVFAELGGVLQDVDGLIREREKASSALARAMLEGRTQDARERLEGMQSRIEGLIEKAVAEFPRVERGERDGWELGRELGFLEKWRAEVRDRYGRLW
jgi:hypothetical protein